MAGPFVRAQVLQIWCWTHLKSSRGSNIHSNTVYSKYINDNIIHLTTGKFVVDLYQNNKWGLIFSVWSICWINTPLPTYSIPLPTVSVGVEIGCSFLKNLWLFPLEFQLAVSISAMKALSLIYFIQKHGGDNFLSKEKKEKLAPLLYKNHIICDFCKKN